MAVGDGVSALASLAVTFGGFSPTAMDGVEATRKHIERVEAAHAKLKEAERRRREIQRARASAPKRFVDDRGSQWTYVVMDDAFIRIDSCKREQPHTIIPAEIDGLPVRALGSDIFHESDVLESIVCPDTIESIGSCAFRLLANLKRVVFPAQVATYSASWLQHCSSIEEISLPGSLTEITASIFENTSLRALHIGASVMQVAPGACEKTALDTLTIDEANPFLFTDGDAIYSHDGKVMIALARPVVSYSVREGCVSLAKKCCMGISSLQEITLSDSLEVLGEFALAHTSVVEVSVPPSVTDIQAKAFFHCSKLESVHLPEGLVSLGDSAFAESALRGILIPSTIQNLGSSITVNTNVVHSGEGVTFFISEDSESLFFDGQGGLYRHEDDGTHFVQLIDREETEYAVLAGTVVIDEYAFAFHDRIEKVVLPEGVVEIRKSAFRVCRNLRQVEIPDTLRIIGKEAFIDTSLEAIRLPAGFENLSEDALITAGAHHLAQPPSLRSIEVAQGNAHYYVQAGLLCKRGDDGDRGIVFNDDVADVVIPDGVTSIAPFAYSNARNIRTFTIGPNLKAIGTAGFSTWSFIEDIHIELSEPVEGRRVFDIRFPKTQRAVHEISISLGGSAWVNVPDILRHYDNCLAHGHNYHAPSDEDISAYEQVKLMIGRFKDPIALVPVNKNMFERIIREHLEDICIDVARHDDRAVIDDLCDFGFLNSDNLEDVTVAVGRLQDAAMTGYLLELKRRRFGRAAFDFDL